MEEGPANLFLSQEVARRLAREKGGLKNTENLNKVLYSQVLERGKGKTVSSRKTFDEEIQTPNIKSFTAEEVKEFVELVDAKTVKEALERQNKKQLVSSVQ